MKQMTIKIRLSTYRILQDKHDQWKAEQLKLERKDRPMNLSFSQYMDSLSKGEVV